ncbi:MAG: Nmad5 family putative nucleotide modification protein [Amphritea sp.]|nr:Nmad5 family putative nucleotide modification protein [Amphritea sp.]
MSRLTNTIKDRIITAVLKDKIYPKTEAQRAKAQKIADRTAENHYSADIQEWLKAAPAGGAYQRNTIKLKTEGDGNFAHYMLGDNHSIEFTLSKPMRILASDQYTYTFFPSKRDQGYLRDILKTLNTIEKERDDLLTTIRAALNSCTTLKKLETEYPSLKKYVPENPAAQSTNLPAVTDQKVAEALAA